MTDRLRGNKLPLSRGLESDYWPSAICPSESRRFNHSARLQRGKALTMLGIWRAAMKCAFDSESPNGAHSRTGFFVQLELLLQTCFPRTWGREGLRGHGQGMWLRQVQPPGVLPGLSCSICCSRDPGLWMPELAAHEPCLGVCREHNSTAAHGGRPSLSGKGYLLSVIYGRTTPQKP